MVIVAISKKQTGTALLVITAAFIFGLWRGNLVQSQLSGYRMYYGYTINLTGKISEDAEIGTNGDQRLKLIDCKINGISLAGQAWVSTYSKTQLKRSDSIVVHGKLKTGFGSFPASMNYAVITSVTYNHSDYGLQIRDWFAASVKRAIPEPQSSLAVGFLVGQHSSLPHDLDNQLKVVGLTHIIVASGYNLTILVVFSRRLMLGLSKFMATFFASSMIFGFVAITGLSPSMSRAALVSGLSLLAWYYGRKIHPLVLLPFAAAITVALNPTYLWGDIGWYLSFVSFAGVLLLAPLVHQFFWGEKQPGALKEIFIATLCAQLATLPIIIFTFGHYSVYALAANLLVLPLIPFTMILTFFAGLLGIFLPHFSILFGLPATIILRYMTSVISYIANLPGAQGELSISALIVTLAYLILAGIAYILWRKTHYNFRKEKIAD